MAGIYNVVWRSLSLLYLDNMSPVQHLAVMAATAVTIVAILVGGCWTYQHRRGSSDNSADSNVNLQADGNSIRPILHSYPLYYEYFHFSNRPMVFRGLNMFKIMFKILKLHLSCMYMVGPIYRVPAT